MHPLPAEVQCFSAFIFRFPNPFGSKDLRKPWDLDLSFILRPVCEKFLRIITPFVIRVYDSLSSTNPLSLRELRLALFPATSGPFLGKSMRSCRLNPGPLVLTRSCKLSLGPLVLARACRSSPGPLVLLR